jgi:hypothetical protein
VWSRRGGVRVWAGRRPSSKRPTSVSAGALQVRGLVTWWRGRPAERELGRFEEATGAVWSRRGGVRVWAGRSPSSKRPTSVSAGALQVRGLVTWWRGRPAERELGRFEEATGGGVVEAWWCARVGRAEPFFEAADLRVGRSVADLRTRHPHEPSTTLPVRDLRTGERAVAFRGARSLRAAGQKRSAGQKAKCSAGSSAGTGVSPSERAIHATPVRRASRRHPRARSARSSSASCSGGSTRPRPA